MRLFGIVDGQIDADDRAGWFTFPFGTPPAAPPLPDNVPTEDAPYRRPPPQFDNYRRLFGQSDDYT